MNSGITENLTFQLWGLLEYDTLNINQYDAVRDQLAARFSRFETPMQISTEAVEDLFFNLEIVLYDADDNLAPNINITIYETDNDGDIVAELDNIKSNNQGKVYFTQLKSNNLTVNITYENPYHPDKPIIHLGNFTHELTTTTSIDVRDKIGNLNITMVSFNLVKLGSGTAEGGAEPVFGANVEIYSDDVANPSNLIGTKATDAAGFVQFYYINSSTDYSLKVSFYGAYRLINKTTGASLETLTFTMPNQVMLDISVQLLSFDSTFQSDKSTLEDTNMYGDNIVINFQYFYTYGTENGGITFANLTYQITEGSTIRKSGDVTELSNGNYRLTIDSADGSFGLQPEKYYLITIIATKPGFEQKTILISFRLTPIGTTLTLNQLSIEKAWNENFTIRSTYLDTIGGPLNSAEVTYLIFNEYESFEGSLPLIGNGIYEKTFNTTDLNRLGIYTIKISASQLNYATLEKTATLRVEKIQTRLNKTIAYFAPISLNVTTELILEFEYKDIYGQPIVGTTATFQWQFNKTGDVFTSDLKDIGNGLYRLDFNTTTRQMGEYSLVVTIGDGFYFERNAFINLEIVPIPIKTTFTTLESRSFKIAEGGNIIITFDLVDPTTNLPLTGLTQDEIYMEYRGKTFYFTEGTLGTYSCTIDTATESYDALFAAVEGKGLIYIIKTNYTIQPIEITILVTPPEFLIGGTGIPKIFVYIALISFGLIGSILIANKAIRYGKIPAEIKRIMLLRKIIKKKGEAPRENLTNTYEELMENDLSSMLKKIGVVRNTAKDSINEEDRS
jgi:hypothetical protein